MPSKLEPVTMGDPSKMRWTPHRSKIKAAFKNGLSESYFRVHRLLYIGAAHGYTLSHINEHPVEVYAVEKSHAMMRHFLPYAMEMPNVLPILADAAAPDSFAQYIPEPVDVIFQDIAQKDQVGIFMANCERFLNPQGVGMLAMKAPAVDSTAEPAAVFAETRQQLEKRGATIVQEISLEPYQKHHRLFVVHIMAGFDNW